MLSLARSGSGLYAAESHLGHLGPAEKVKACCGVVYHLSATTAQSCFPEARRALWGVALERVGIEEQDFGRKTRLQLFFPMLAGSTNLASTVVC